MDADPGRGRGGRGDVDVVAVEAWLGDVEATDAALDWQVDGLDVWPLFLTTLLNLAVEFNIGRRRGRVTVGSRAWRAGVVADAVIGGRARRMLGSGSAFGMPEWSLADGVLCHGSGLHFRKLGGVHVAPPLDVTALLLRRDGGAVTYWIDDLDGAAARGHTYLSGRAHGGLDLMRAARARAKASDVARVLAGLAGFERFIGEGSRVLGTTSRFLRLWLARQIAYALSFRECYGEVFDRCGRPRVLIVMSGGSAYTVGIIAAAKARGIIVIEPQHGVESPVSLVRQRRRRHFSSFNSACDAYVAWDIPPGVDRAIASSVPAWHLLPDAVAATHGRDSAAVRLVAAAISETRAQLEQHARAVGARFEILVSLQPGDEGEWLAPIVAGAPEGSLFWVRRHGADQGVALPGATRASIEMSLAQSVALPVLLERVAAHVTRFSSVTLEAAAVGVPTFALETYAEVLFRRSVPADLLVVCDVENGVRGMRELVAGARAVTARGLDTVHQHDLQSLASFLRSRLDGTSNV
ncbi:MAG TPA: hypothetical protein PK970_01895 [Hyphomicrobiaceae bacterium]|nr:hypothetical protein [Hyphomicrobiaceae bacterium]